MLDCDPLDTDELSEADSGGVSAPELVVIVLDRERPVREGRVNTRVFSTTKVEHRPLKSGQETETYETQ